MPPRKKTNLSRLTVGASRMRRKRATESPTQRARRLEMHRLRQVLKRATETSEQREERLRIGKIRVRLLRKSRTSARRLKSKGNSSSSSNSGKENNFLLDKKLKKKLNCKYNNKVGRKRQSSVKPHEIHDCIEDIIKLEPPSSPLPFLPVKK